MADQTTDRGKAERRTRPDRRRARRLRLSVADSSLRRRLRAVLGSEAVVGRGYGGFMAQFVDWDLAGQPPRRWARAGRRVLRGGRRRRHRPAGAARTRRREHVSSFTGLRTQLRRPRRCASSTAADWVGDQHRRPPAGDPAPGRAACRRQAAGGRSPARSGHGSPASRPAPCWRSCPARSSGSTRSSRDPRPAAPGRARTSSTPSASSAPSPATSGSGCACTRSPTGCSSPPSPGCGSFPESRSARSWTRPSSTTTARASGSAGRRRPRRRGPRPQQRGLGARPGADARPAGRARPASPR